MLETGSDINLMRSWFWILRTWQSLNIVSSTRYDFKINFYGREARNWSVAAPIRIVYSFNKDIAYKACVTLQTISIYRETSHSVTTDSQSLISCNLVIPKWSTKSEPSTSRAKESGFKNKWVASFRSLASLRDFSFVSVFGAPNGAIGNASFFSTPRIPRPIRAARA